MIALSGLDCSGKSTQIIILANKFKYNRSIVFIFWSRGGYTPGIQKLKNILRLLLKNKLPKPGQSKTREHAFRQPIIRRIWLSLAILDLIFFYGIYLRYKEAIGYKVICDRYMLDTEIDFFLNFSEENIPKWMLWKILKLVAIKPSTHFVCLVPVDVSVTRSKQKYEPFPDTPEVLYMRLLTYQKELNNKNNLIYINGLLPIEEISNKIYSKVFKYVEER